MPVGDTNMNNKIYFNIKLMHTVGKLKSNKSLYFTIGKVS